MNKELRNADSESEPTLTYADMQQLLHELQVRKVELEAQNAELQAARDENLVLGTYADLYDFAPVGYLSLDRNGTILKINFTCAELLGNERSVLIGQIFTRFITEEERPGFFDLLNTVLKNKVTEMCDMVLLIPVSTSRIVVRMEVTASSTGEECRVALINITARKNMEKELRASEAHLNEAQRLTKLGSWERDYTQDTLSWTDEMYRITELAPAEFSNNFDTYLAVVHPDDRGGFLKTAHDAHKAQKPYEFEYRLKMPDGRIKWVHSRATTSYDQHGKPLLMTGTTQDITKRKQADDARRRSEVLLKLIVDAVPALISYVDAECRYRLVNRRYEEIFGVKAESICGSHVRDVLGKAAWAIASPFVELALAGEQVSYEVSLPNKEGGLRSYQALYIPDRDDEGLIRGYVALGLDVTVQKATEQALHSYGQRLLDLEEEVRRKLAAELHDEMGPDLTALNFTLSLIKESFETVQSQYLEELVTDAAQVVNGLSGKVRNIIARLQPPVLFDYGLEAALRWYAELMMKRTDMLVAIVTEGTVPRLPKDHELALFRIAKEALTNAAKYSGAKSVTVTLGCTDSTVRLSVADDGTGFVPSPASPPGANGWGLTIMRERTEMLGGTFRLETAPGAGATIYSEIPLEDDDVD